jgi:phospholipid/cholesterol/gamma-HCH transport system substrate-binding protein
MGPAAKVGAFVVLFGVLGLGAMSVLRSSVFAPKLDRYVAEFADAGGVSVGSPVMLAGVEVGSVEKVELTPSGTARLSVSVLEGTRVPKDAVATVPGSLLTIGDTRVLLSGDPGTGTLPPGSVIPGRLGTPMEALGLNLDSALEEMQATLAAVRTVVEDEGLRGGVEKLLVSLDRTTTKFGALAGRVDGLVARNQAGLERSLAAASGSLQNLQAVSVEVRKLVASGELQGKATELLDSLQAAVEQGRGLVSDLRAMANDPSLRGAVDETLANVKVMSQSGTRIAADAEVMAKNGVEVSEEAVVIMRKANKLADEVESLIRKFNKTVEDLTKSGKSLVGDVQVEATLTAETKPGRVRTDLNAIVPVGSEKLTVGLYDAFETNRINLQLVRPIGQGTDLRYGVYASKPGLGVDYALAPRVGLRADVFGLNDPRLDARLRFDLGKSVTGWAGVERIFAGNAPSVGVTVRR